MQFLAKKWNKNNEKTRNRGSKCPMGQKYVKRGQHGAKWVNTDQKRGSNGLKG